MQVSFWTLLRVGNWALAILIVLVAFFTSPFFYLSSPVLVMLAIASSIAIHGISIEGERSRSSITLITLLFFLGFYQLRLVTLLSGFESTVLLRGLMTEQDFALGYLYSSAVLLLTSVGAIWMRRKSEIPTEPAKPMNRYNFILWFFVGTLLLHLFVRYVPLNPFALKVPGYILSIFSPLTAYVGLLIGFLIQRKNLSRTQFIISILFVGVFLLDCILAGKRSMLLTSFLIFVFAVGFAHLRVFLNWKTAAVGVMVVLVGLMQFEVSDFIRKSGAHVGLRDIARHFAVSRIWNPESYNELFDRLGALDSSIELIAHSDRYREIVNLPYAVTSAIDNNSPGQGADSKFVRISYGLRYLYFAFARPSASNINEEYQSDFVTFPAQLWLMFGPICGLLIAFLTGAFFSYFDQSHSTGTMTFLGAISPLYFYVFILNDFGLDWTLIESFRLLLFCVAFSLAAAFFERIRGVSASKS